MRAAGIFGVERFSFVEPSFSALTDPVFNTALAKAGADEGLLLIDENEDPIAIAFHTPDGWIAGSFLYRNPSAALIGKFEDAAGEIFQEDGEVWAAAVREYYSLALMRDTMPAVEDVKPGRFGILEDIIADCWGKGKGGTCLDFCCGSGVGSAVMRSAGFVPLSCDNDAALLARGLVAGRLLPEETMWIDATKASRYTGRVKRGVGVMMGEINTFTQDLWQQLVTELLALSDETLITVGTQKEAELVRAWGAAAGRTITIGENDRDPLYDRRVCQG